MPDANKEHTSGSNGRDISSGSDSVTISGYGGVETKSVTISKRYKDCTGEFFTLEILHLTQEQGLQSDLALPAKKPTQINE